MTWRREGRLRGCIGTVEPSRPLAEDVALNAVEALLHDPHFLPRPPGSFRGTRSRDSGLDRPRAHRRPRGDRDRPARPLRGKGLPARAPPSSGCTRAGLDEKFLEQVCLKAGLPADAWQNGNPRASVFRFGADVFSEGLLLVTPAS